MGAGSVPRQSQRNQQSLCWVARTTSAPRSRASTLAPEYANAASMARLSSAPSGPSTLPLLSTTDSMEGRA